jgi:hypothetical protein
MQPVLVEQDRKSGDGVLCMILTIYCLVANAASAARGIGAPLAGTSAAGDDLQ